jgi:hypothetical protein
VRSAEITLGCPSASGGDQTLSAPSQMALASRGHGHVRPLRGRISPFRGESGRVRNRRVGTLGTEAGRSALHPPGGSPDHRELRVSRAAFGAAAIKPFGSTQRRSPTTVAS